MKDQILERIHGMFDAPVMQNNLRGLWVEAMVCELLGDGWAYAGADWAAWDLEDQSGMRVEIKQSARMQTWGMSIHAPRFSIKAPQGHFPDGVSYVRNVSGERFADLYIFAWHNGDDQRDTEQWHFFMVPTNKLPARQGSIGLAGIQKLTDPIFSDELLIAVEDVKRETFSEKAQLTVEASNAN